MPRQLLPSRTLGNEVGTSSLRHQEIWRFESLGPDGGFRVSYPLHPRERRALDPKSLRATEVRFELTTSEFDAQGVTARHAGRTLRRVAEQAQSVGNQGVTPAAVADSRVSAESSRSWSLARCSSGRSLGSATELVATRPRGHRNRSGWIHLSYVGIWSGLHRQFLLRTGAGAGQVDAGNNPP